jgi:hypothetical protein
MEVSTYKSLVEHLQSKGFPDIANKILNGNKLTKSNKYKFRSAVPYILNKLNNLYNINNGEQITPDSLTGIHDNTKFAQMVDNTKKFKNTKLNDMVDSIVRNNNIEWCLMHGRHTDTIFRVPANTIIVLIAPTNRILLQNIDNYTSFVKLLKDKNFIKEYLKNPACLSTQNYCFKYATILYPGQLCFELMLKGPTDTDTDTLSESMGFYNKWGVTSANTYSTLSKFVKAGNPTINYVNFIYSCRACNLDLSHKLVEVLYYNEYVCNFINKNKNICKLKNKANNSNTLCNNFMFTKKNYSINNNVPKLNFTPINNNKDTDIVQNIIYTFLMYTFDETQSVTTTDFKDLFIGFQNIAKKNMFFKYIIDINNLLETKFINFYNINLYYELFSPRLMKKWISFIKTNFFNSENKLIYEDDIINFCKKNDEYKVGTEQIIYLVNLILGQFLIYYFYTNNKKHVSCINILLDKLNKNMLFIKFIKNIKFISSDKIKTINYYIPPSLFDIPEFKYITLDDFVEHYEDVKRYLTQTVFNKEQDSDSKSTNTVIKHKRKKSRILTKKNTSLISGTAYSGLNTK